ncbi:MAG: OOP family OmpA-OmpF porin [Myxococcota bacterium]|jgi:OOP family OmpA-OmpF porin
MRSAPRSFKFLKITAPFACVATLALACVSPPPPIDSLDAEPLELAANEGIRTDQTVILFDASGSMKAQNQFASTQNLASSFVMGMPEGAYGAAVVTFGGDANQVLELAPFDRDEVDSAVIDGELLGKSSDIAGALDEIAPQLIGRSGTTAVIVFSDGVAAQHGRNLGSEGAIAAARRLAFGAGSDGEICFYTVQSGSDPAGGKLMGALASVTTCGQHIAAADLADVESLQAFQQSIFVEETSAPVSTPPPAPEHVFVDDDLDGIDDIDDQCLGTPMKAHVNEVGCWVLDSYAFESQKSEILEAQYGELNNVAEVLKMNPDLRIRIDGHTDASGSAQLNQDLSEQRAAAVRNYLEGVGIDSSRLETQGFGMTAPVASNDTAAGKAKNRRCQMTVLK